MTTQLPNRDENQPDGITALIRVQTRAAALAEAHQAGPSESIDYVMIPWKEVDDLIWSQIGALRLLRSLAKRDQTPH